MRKAPPLVLIFMAASIGGAPITASAQLASPPPRAPGVKPRPSRPSTQSLPPTNADGADCADAPGGCRWMTELPSTGTVLKMIQGPDAAVRREAVLAARQGGGMTLFGVLQFGAPLELPSCGQSLGLMTMRTAVGKALFPDLRATCIGRRDEMSTRVATEMVRAQTNLPSSVEFFLVN